jgi:hypothetical protein
LLIVYVEATAVRTHKPLFTKSAVASALLLIYRSLFCLS